MGHWESIDGQFLKILLKLNPQHKKCKKWKVTSGTSSQSQKSQILGAIHVKDTNNINKKKILTSQTGGSDALQRSSPKWISPQSLGLACYQSPLFSQTRQRKEDRQEYLF